MNAGPTETVENEEGTQESEEKKRIELSNACKALKIEIENKHSVFKQANDDLQSLLSTEGDAEHVATAVKSAIARLQSCRTETEKLQNEFIKLSVQCNEEIPVTIQESILDEEKSYNESAGKVKVFCSKNEKAPQPEITTGRESQSGACVRLEKVKFQVFKGDLRNYPTFKKEFLKHIKPKYNADDEAFILKTYLEAEIRNDIQTAGDDAAEIWKRLDKKYGDEGKLIDLIMKDVKQLQNVETMPPRVLSR